MDRWVMWAFASMFFAGCTVPIAKMGLAGISGELGLTIRTVFVCTFVFVFAALSVRRAEFAAVGKANIWWLGLSGAFAALSWIFYYKALKAGDVATVALIDKGSVLVAMILAWVFLRETVTPRMLAGACMIIAGLIVIAKKP